MSKIKPWCEIVEATSEFNSGGHIAQLAHAIGSSPRAIMNRLAKRAKELVSKNGVCSIQLYAERYKTCEFPGGPSVLKSRGTLLVTALVPLKPHRRLKRRSR